MPFVAGNDIDAFCPSCGRDSEQTVLDVHGGVVHTVRCKSCAAVHPYQRPHGPPRATAKPSKPSRKRAAAKPRAKAPVRSSWELLVEGRSPSEARAYSVAETFLHEELVAHPKFGLGVVTEVLADGKIEVVFEDTPRKLVHGRV